MPRASDPSNRVSGNAAAIAFGDAVSGAFAIAHGHRRVPRPVISPSARSPMRCRARGVALADRNTTSLANVATQRWYGWDGAADNLWAQSLRPSSIAAK